MAIANNAESVAMENFAIAKCNDTFRKKATDH